MRHLCGEREGEEHDMPSAGRTVRTTGERRKAAITHTKLSAVINIAIRV
jgi:hypothetical protein